MKISLTLFLCWLAFLGLLLPSDSPSDLTERAIVHAKARLVPLETYLIDRANLIAGAVSDSAGLPIEGVSVSLFNLIEVEKEMRQGSTAWQSPTCEARCDSDINGRYSFKGVANGPKLIVFEKQGFMTESSVESSHVDGYGLPNQDIVLTSLQGQGLSFNNFSGEPLAALSVRVLPQQWTQIPFGVMADESGSVELSGFAYNPGKALWVVVGSPGIPVRVVNPDIPVVLSEKALFEIKEDFEEGTSSFARGFASLPIIRFENGLSIDRFETFNLVLSPSADEGSEGGAEKSTNQSKTVNERENTPLDLQVKAEQNRKVPEAYYGEGAPFELLSLHEPFLWRELLGKKGDQDRRELELSVKGKSSGLVWSKSVTSVVAERPFRPLYFSMEDSSPGWTRANNLSQCSIRGYPGQLLIRSQDREGHLTYPKGSLAAGGDAEIVFTSLDSRNGGGACIFGFITSASGIPIVGADVFAQGPGERFPGKQVSDLNGFFRFDDRPPGGHLLAARNKDEYSASLTWASVMIGGSADAQVDFIIHNGSITLHGAGLDRAFQAALITLEGNEVDVRMTGEAPTMTFSCLAEGVYRITLEDEEGKQISSIGEIKILSGSQEIIEVD